MTPTEKAIQSRIKEAFALKVNPEVWVELMAQIEKENYSAPTFKVSGE
jgi:hypothetical protein